MGSRDVQDLFPVVRDLCDMFLEACRQRGLDVIITSTLRSGAEQWAYFVQGRKSLNFVNQARAQAELPPITQRENRIITYKMLSAHEMGLAFDVALRKHGAIVWEIKADVNENHIPDYEEIGAIGEALGLKWGGRFKHRDYVHFEYSADQQRSVERAAG